MKRTASEARIASPSAPPIWREVFTSPEARPASLGARGGGGGDRRGDDREADARSRRAGPAAGSPRRSSPSTEMRANSASPAAISARPAAEHGPGAEARDEAARLGRAGHDRERHRQEREARVERPEVQHFLQVERAEVPHREQRGAEQRSRRCWRPAAGGWRTPAAARAARRRTDPRSRTNAASSASPTRDRAERHERAPAVRARR